MEIISDDGRDKQVPELTDSTTAAEHPADPGPVPPDGIDIEPPPPRGKRDDDALFAAVVTRWAMRVGLWPVIIAPKGAILRYKTGEKIAEGKEALRKGWGITHLTVDHMRYWRKQYPGAGVGICFGPGRAPGGYWLVDLEIDGGGGEESFIALCGGEVVLTLGWKSARGAHRVMMWMASGSSACWRVPVRSRARDISAESGT